jgi:hypothetical protein
MSRIPRFAVLAAMVFVAGCALATGGSVTSGEPAPLASGEEDTPPTAEDLAHASERLAASGFDVTDELLAELADQYGVGGAIRIVAWSDGDAARMAEIRAMRDGDGTEGSRMGWGQIAAELGEDPGIGWIMGGGPEGSPGEEDPDD